MAKASASYTIMDYTDGVTLLGSIEANRPRTSLYDTATQTINPSWASTSLTLTPKLIKAGSATDLIASCTNAAWMRRISGGSWANVSSANGESMAAATKILTVNKDALVGDVWQVEYKFSCTYHDPVLNLDLTHEDVITFSRVANGTSFVVARAYASAGNQFKNGLPASLPLKAELIRGTTQDTTSLTYKWQLTTNGTTWADISGATTDTLSVTAAMVDSFAMFRCQITDTDASSDTYNDTFVTEGVTILDVSDPLQVVIESAAGTFFKNNTGSTILKARVFRDGAELDIAGTAYTYTWTQTDKDGVAVSSFAPTEATVAGITKGKKKAIIITHDMVTVKGTFFCNID
jgi:hypothetical protein